MTPLKLDKRLLSGDEPTTDEGWNEDRILRDVRRHAFDLFRDALRSDDVGIALAGASVLEMANDAFRAAVIFENEFTEMHNAHVNERNKKNDRT